MQDQGEAPQFGVEFFKKEEPVVRNGTDAAK
jgi:hypothetical protein